MKAATFASIVIVFDPRLRQTAQDCLRFWGVLSATYTELPGAQLLGKFPPSRPFSFHSLHFIFVSIWHWNVIQLAQRAIRSAGDSFKANSEMRSCPLPLSQSPWAPDPYFPVKQRRFFFFLSFFDSFMNSKGTISAPQFGSFFLLCLLIWTWSRRLLWDSPRFWHTISGPVGFSTGGRLDGEGWECVCVCVGGVIEFCADTYPKTTADAWALSPANLITSLVWDTTARFTDFITQHVHPKDAGPNATETLHWQKKVGPKVVLTFLIIRLT